MRDEEARAPLANARTRLVFDLKLRPGQKLRFCWPVTRPADEVSESYDVFMRSGDAAAMSGGLHMLLTAARAPAVSKKPRFADAISVAALSASGRNRARAVLFLYGGSPDGSPSRPRSCAAISRSSACLSTSGRGCVERPESRALGHVTLVRDYPDFLAGRPRSSSTTSRRSGSSGGTASTSRSPHRFAERDRDPDRGVRRAGLLFASLALAASARGDRRPAAPKARPCAPGAPGETVEVPEGTRLYSKPGHGGISLSMVDVDLTLPIRSRCDAWVEVVYDGLRATSCPATRTSRRSTSA